MKTLTKMEKKFAKKLHVSFDKSPEDRLAEKESRAAYIRKFEVDGYVGIDWTSLDCDMCMGSGHAIVPATLVAVESWINDLYDGAEGPTSADIRKPDYEEAGYHQPRDLAMEAHENGHPHVVYA